MKHTFVVEVPVSFAVSVEADNIHEAIAKAKAATDVRVLRNGESDFDLTDVWCTSVRAITEDVDPSKGELCDILLGEWVDGFYALADLWNEVQP